MIKKKMEVKLLLDVKIIELNQNSIVASIINEMMIKKDEVRITRECITIKVVVIIIMDKLMAKTISVNVLTVEALEADVGPNQGGVLIYAIFISNASFIQVNLKWSYLYLINTDYSDVQMSEMALKLEFREDYPVPCVYLFVDRENCAVDVVGFSINTLLICAEGRFKCELEEDDDQDDFEEEVDVSDQEDE
ncbi:MAG: hypothetical protein EZS28_025786 [Streblomastix strix]|uniref:Uncharacterized protein n=1 Tax=Streblomastix strix TaxID=222440 RepID=A0A5J4V7Q4_9EUKA|nr:MAG: hypothetical protein EZS28_025786 [Streblomastix strix]